MQAAIEARAVGLRTRAGEVAVRDITMAIGHGELVAITGGGGSGKSTLLDAISGLRPPTSGAVIHRPEENGRPAGRRTVRRTGYVTAEDVIHPVLPLARALRYTAALRSVRDPDLAVGEALGVAGLAARAAVPCGDLDPGERKRAAIAAELLSRPAELFLDEPTAGLDPAQAVEVLRLLRRLSGSGITVVLTTSSPLDAARCDKIAVLADGGHLAFFGTPAAACGYFGADDLEEIYERLAGVGDVVAAWSRRFFQFPWTTGLPSVPATAPPPGPGSLVPDSAGPHSAGRPTAPAAWADPEDSEETGAARPAPLSATGRGGRAAGGGETGDPAGADSAATANRGSALIQSARQLPVLIRRNVEVVSRSAFARTALAVIPAAVLIAFAVLIGAGAFDAPRADAAWAVLGGSCIGLAYGLPQARGESGVLRAERFGGLSAAAYVLARLAVLLPALAAADAIAILVPAAAGRLPYGYGPDYVTLLLSSAVALGLGLLFFATDSARRRPVALVAALRLPVLLLADAVLALLDRPAGWDWLVLAAIIAALAAAAIAAVARAAPAAPLGR